MPVSSTDGNNVPHIGPRSRYMILNNSPTWVYHEMASGQTMAGEAPRTASVAEADLDPVTSAGMAKFSDLSKGGLFTLLAHYKKAMVVEAVDNAGSATITIIKTSAPGSSRTAPTAPFRVGPGECLKVSGGGAAGKVGFLVRRDFEESI